MSYKLELDKDSPGLEQFITYYTSSDVGYNLLEKENMNIFSKRNLGSEQKTIEYYQYNDEQLKNYYAHLFDSTTLDSDFIELRKSKETLFQPVEDKEMYHLPEIELTEGNIFHIETTENKEQFVLTDLLSEYRVENSDKIIFNVVAVNENSFQIDIHDKNVEDPLKRDFSIFMTQDLQNVFVTQTFTEEFLQNIVQGKLQLYEDLLLELDAEKRFIKAANSHVIVDTLENEFVQMNEADFVSENDNYVYVNGKEDPLAEGKQRIQTIEDYLVGNDDFEIEFHIDYERISDFLELKSTGNVSTGKIAYFNEDFVVLFLNFTAPFGGTAGSTNVIIDLQEDKENPTYYLLELGLQ